MAAAPGTRAAAGTPGRRAAGRGGVTPLCSAAVVSTLGSAGTPAATDQQTSVGAVRAVN